MKKILLLLTFASSIAFGQNTQQISASEYATLKSNNLLNPNTNYVFTDVSTGTPIHYSGGTEKTGLCDCMVPLDTNFILAMSPNDDGSSGLINLPFTFDFYGTPYNSLYINNNGNISFIGQYNSFVPNAFPDASFNMIAPFWADVDTYGSSDSIGNILSGGEVWYKVTSSSIVIKWESVGYFPSQTDKLNTFQLIISNGQDPLVNGGGNVAFCYGDMQWTTGSASGGSGGFGGSAATVGVNIGNGVDYFQVGQFDQPGIAFDGPVGLNDGIDFLDGQEVYFNIAGASSSNTPPLLIASAICDTIDVFTGDTLVKSGNSVDFNFGVMAGEVGQTVAVSHTTNAPAGAFSHTISTIDDNFLVVNATFDATSVSPGVYNVDFTATDNGIPTGVTHQTFSFKVVYDEALGINTLSTESFEMYPNPVKDQLTITLSKGTDEAQATIIDLTGKTILSQTITNTSTLSLTNVQAGLYLVNLYQNETLLGSNKLIKE